MMRTERLPLLLAMCLLLAGALAGCAEPESTTAPSNQEDSLGIDSGEDDFGPGAEPAPGQEEEGGQEGLLPPP